MSYWQSQKLDFPIKIVNHTSNALTLELKAFLHAIRTGERPIVSGEDGRRALDVAHRIIERVHEHADRVNSRV